jgi:hypothetical protein
MAKTSNPADFPGTTTCGVAVGDIVAVLVGGSGVEIAGMV